MIDFTIAAIRPGIVNCFAVRCGCRSNSRNVADVIGPIEANLTACSLRLCAVRLPSKATKFLTVDELVKVTDSGAGPLVALAVKAATGGALDTVM